MNGYPRDLLQERVAIAKRYVEQTPTFGGSSTVTKYEWLNKVESDHGFWCKHDWTRGLKAMHEGALDAYDTVMFRMDFDPAIDRWCLLKFEGKWYQIQSLNGIQRENKLQITAVELANQQVNIVEPTPDPEPETPAVNPEQQNDGTINDNDNDSNS